jgi:hypothetical protein
VPSSAQKEAESLRRERALAKLREQRKSCSFNTARSTLELWGFTISEKKGRPAIAFRFERTVIMGSFHRPHGKDDMDKGAVAYIISAIEEASVLIEEREGREKEN